MGASFRHDARSFKEKDVSGLSEEDLSGLSRLPLFSNLSDGCLRKVADESRIVRYQRSDVLFGQGETADWLHILIEGQVSLAGSVRNSEETVVDILKSGEAFIVAAVLTGKPYLMSAKALATSKVLLLPAAKLLNDLREYPELALAMLSCLAGHFRTLVTEVKDLKLKSASQRLALYLMSLTPRREGSAILHLPHNKILIAGRVGVRPETLSRVFFSLKKEGVVSEHQTVAITDLKRLAAFCHEGAEII
ncbi:MAG: cyclic nucleotide-binding domain-containing protein [Rhodospirillales bacterium]|nr:MAG: cyclic nucleotide-binding domain-containing protein [Rhodospirillales bacterium]